MNVKIPRTKLIELVEAARDRKIEHAKKVRGEEMMSHPAKLKAWQDKVVPMLTEALRLARAGKEPGEPGYNALRWDNFPDAPKGMNVGEMNYLVKSEERALRLLRASSDEYVSLNDKSDYFQYI